MIRFVCRKSANPKRIQALLEHCSQEQQWANRGPLYRMLAEAYAVHFNLPTSVSVTPCSNGGIALEAMARLLTQKAGRPLRWIGPAFGFQNLGRGYFSSMDFVDCDAQGRLDMDLVAALSPESYDGIVVVNPFGINRDFDRYISFANETGKHLLIDNAAGVDTVIPDWPWQAFSLHHTKPYGLGEGGLALTPSDEAEPLYALLNYGPVPDDPALWLNNGKLSDIACAYLIERLETAEQWRPLFEEQALRVERLALGFGFEALLPVAGAAPAMSCPFVGPRPIPLERVAATPNLTLGKYYKPLASLPKTEHLYARLVNIPTHPDVAMLDDTQLEATIASLLLD